MPASSTPSMHSSGQARCVLSPFASSPAAYVASRALGAPGPANARSADRGLPASSCPPGHRVRGGGDLLLPLRGGALGQSRRGLPPHPAGRQRRHAPRRTRCVLPSSSLAHIYVRGACCACARMPPTRACVCFAGAGMHPHCSLRPSALLPSTFTMLTVALSGGLWIRGHMRFAVRRRRGSSNACAQGRAEQ